MLNRTAKCVVWSALVAAVGLAGVRQTQAATPTDITATVRSGQTFLTWQEVPDARTYKVYRDTAPLTEAALDAAHCVATVPQGSARNMGLEDIAAQQHLKVLDPAFTIVRHVVVPLADDAIGAAAQLGEHQGVVVLTTHKPGSYHYAVTAVTAAGEDRTLSQGNTVGPIAERVETPEPLLIWQAKSKCARVYLQYRNLDDWNDSMSNIYAYPYWVGVRKDHTPGPRTNELRVYLGGYYGPIGGDNVSRYADVCIRTHEAGCWWWGFSSTYQYDRTKYHLEADSPIATTGPMKNYVQARYIDFVRWLIDQPYYAIDPDAVHTFGGSMGGVGSLTMLMDYPDMFAYGQISVPPTNLLGVEWKWLRNCEAKIGPHDSNSIMVDFHGPDADRLRKRWGGMTTREFFNLEKRLEAMQADDLPYMWMASCGRDDSVNWPQQGRNAYTILDATRRAWSGGLKGAGGHLDLGGDGGGVKFPKQFRTIRRNQSFPAFSNVVAAPTLPLPDKPEDRFYFFNSQFIWSSATYMVAGVQEQIDTPERYEIVIASVDGDQIADVTPRRLQKFKVVPGVTYMMRNTDATDTNKLYESQMVTADRFGLLTFKKCDIKAGDRTTGGSRLTIVPVR